MMKDDLDWRSLGKVVRLGSEASSASLQPQTCCNSPQWQNLNIPATYASVALLHILLYLCTAKARLFFKLWICKHCLKRHKAIIQTVLGLFWLFISTLESLGLKTMLISQIRSVPE